MSPATNESMASRCRFEVMLPTRYEKPMLAFPSINPNTLAVATNCVKTAEDLAKGTQKSGESYAPTILSVGSSDSHVSMTAIAAVSFVLGGKE